MFGSRDSRTPSDNSAGRSWASPSGESTAGARRSFVSGRSAILLTIAVIAVILLALPLREYLSQRAEISSAGAKAAEQHQRVDELQRQVDLWQDEDYIRGQARERLHFLLPGEVGYKVINPDAAENKLAQQPVASDGPRGPWYDRLWSSVDAADRAGSTK
jgi:cell division protein FtsB